ncbi:uncharacterized protein LOC124291055 [Haliotis rubra]|uniref:uncharacterized protein LOC124291055 n=1 Tax=Haliotis rubra TaxID=36100 RepID=UPI001EE59375|nr:uncharacterized protein LOC124291055 [Haliotis rubra]
MGAPSSFTRPSSSRPPTSPQPDENTQSASSGGFFVFEHDMESVNPVLVLKVRFRVFSNAASTVMPVCSGRRKRQAEEGDLTLSRTFKVTIEENGVQTVVKGEISTGGSRTWMVQAVVGIGCVAIAVTVIAIFLGVIITRRRRRSNMKQTDDKSYYTH